MSRIEDWRKAHTQAPQQPLPGLLSKLNILPQPKKLPAPDGSALDSADSSIDGNYTSAHSFSSAHPINPHPSSHPHHPPPVSPSASMSAQLSPSISMSRSLSKSNPTNPGRRASMVSQNSSGSLPGGLSRLTIVRAPSHGAEAAEKPRSGEKGLGLSDQGGRKRAHSGSFPIHPPLSPGLSNRLSFANSSFGSSGSPFPLTPLQAPSVEDLALRPSLRGRRKSSGAGREDASHLTPKEVVDLARETSAAQARARHAESAGRGGAHQATAGMGFGDMEPVEFVPLADDLLLPFDDRSAEMQDLMHAENNASLFRLISLSFSSDSSPAPPVGISASPSEWTYADLEAFLTVGRESVGDRDWVRRVGIAVKGKSEALWEKLKGCLGFDEDDDFEMEGEGEKEYSYEMGAGEERVWIEGLVEGEGQLPLGLTHSPIHSPNARLDRSGSEASLDAFDPSGDPSIVGAVGQFSPETQTSALPSLGGHGGGGVGHKRTISMDIIGEAEEEEDAEGGNSGSSSRQPTRQSTLTASKTPTSETSNPMDSSKNDISPVPAFNLPSDPSNTTPRCSFSGSKRPDVLIDSSAASDDHDYDDSPASSEDVLTPSGQTSRSPNNESSLSATAEPTLASSLNPSSASVSSATNLANTVKERTKSFVGVSILSSSPNPSPAHSGASSGQASFTSSPSFSMTSLAPVPPQYASFSSQRPPISTLGGHSRTPSYHPDDHHFGGNERADPLSERGPGSPLFPTSFASLSLKPISFRTSSIAGQGLASGTGRDIPGAGGKRAGGLDVPGGGANRQWARDIIGTRGMESVGSESALTIGTTPSEYSV